MKAIITIVLLIGSSAYASNGEEWKNKFFQAYPQADVNKDGELSWPEYQEFKQKLDEKNKKASKDGNADAWKAQYFADNPDADTDKDGKLSWIEFKAHKNSKNKPSQNI